MLGFRTSLETKLIRSLENTKKSEYLKIFRIFLLLETFVYGSWWFVVHFTYPDAYNPVWSRIGVVAFSYALYHFSFRSAFVQKHIEPLFYLSVTLLTVQNFHLKFVNYSDVVWPVSTYITVLAVCACFQSLRFLFYYSVFVFTLGIWISAYYNFPYPFYLPGLATVLIASYLVLYQRHLILNRLAEANTRFSELFNATFEGICLHRQGTILAANDAFAEIFGKNREVIIGASVLEITAEDNRDDIRRRANSREAHRYETRGLRSNGTTFPLEVASKPYIWQGEEVRLVAVRDVTERYEVEEQRKKMIQAEAEVQLRDEFISIASHELKTPLTPIKLNNDLLLRATNDQKIFSYPVERLQKIFTINQKQVERLNRLIDDMLDVSRLNRGSLEYRIEEFNLRELIEEVASVFSGECARAGVSLRVIVSEEIFVRMDRHRVEQVLVNLLRNAITYAPGARVLMSAGVRNGQLYLAVRDQGKGIAPEDALRIFRRFERAVSANNYGGMGLGLYITEQIVKAHGGKIILRSRVGKGSTFICEFPPSLIVARRSELSESRPTS